MCIRDSSYIADQGLKVRKFEKDRKQLLEYEFFRAYPIQITSMPVSYEASSLLKCTVSMTYLRYLITSVVTDNSPSLFDPLSQASRNNFFASLVGRLVDAGVDSVTGNDLLGDIAGGIASGMIQNLQD